MLPSRPDRLDAGRGAARPRRGRRRPTCSTESRISGSSGRSAKTCSREASRPPVRSMAIAGPPFSARRSSASIRARVARRTAAGPGRVSIPKVAGSGWTLGSRCSAFSRHQPRMPASNSSVTGSPSQAYSRATSPSGSRCIARKSMSQNRPAPRRSRKSRARRMPADQCSTFSGTEVAQVEVVGEPAGDLGVQVRHRHDDLDRVPVGHHEPGVGEHLVEVIEEQQVGGTLQPPWPGRATPTAAASGRGARRRRSG